MTNICYNYKKIVYNTSIFSNNIDATYIIHLENNGRLEHVMNQLNIYQPTNIVYIVYNKGYKLCKKNDFITNPPSDLVDSFINIFDHAKLLNYNNILILEDDFIFNKEIKSHVNNVNKFLIKKINQDFIYLLGCVPSFIIPYDFYTYRCILSVGTHAVIYSKKYRNKILNIDQKTISDWDLVNLNYTNNRYCYYKPLCYQLFTDTENSKYWGYNYNIQDFSIFFKSIFKILNMDKKPEPGFSIFYIFGKIFWLILLIFIFKTLINIY